tara:strand:- start:260 stop:607 length:348 start_codon:yes stop_codon:yes gene_type:complete
MEIMKLIYGMLVFWLISIGIAVSGEWNEKPVMCASLDETMKAIVEKKEKPVFIAVQATKVREGDRLAGTPAMIPVQVHANLNTGTYTMIEYHPSYQTACIISFGDDFLVQLGKQS